MNEPFAVNPVATPLLQSLYKKDSYTFYHSKNVARLCAKTAKSLGLDEKAQRDVFLSAYLHDIGKIDIENAILKKPGKLSNAEYADIQRHPVLGEGMLLPLDGFTHTADAVRHHHERFDGSGYPDHLHGSGIPLESRIIAVVDAYDAITTRKLPVVRSKLEAIHEIRRNIGSQFDTEIAKEFIRIVD
ncbi:hypothetical protein FACS189492_2270 [Clostridia bacterium]|nr:hypothetical protein FACS189492_2270 [Clostridia bacterium]